MSKEINPDSGKVARAIRESSEGEKSDLDYLLTHSEIHHRPDLFQPNTVSAVVVIPVHRENEVVLLDKPLPNGVVPIVHINDHPRGLHLRYSKKNSSERFRRREYADRSEVEDIEGHPHVIVRTGYISYGSQMRPPTITKTVEYSGGFTRDEEFYILGPYLGDEGQWRYYVELFGPHALLSEIDTVLDGRMRNILLQGKLTHSKTDTNLVVIDSSHIRELSHPEEPPHSIGRARALPVHHLLKQENLSPDTPVFWNDADSYYEPGALEAAIQYYKENPNLLGLFFSRRPILPDADMDPIGIVHHAGSELANALLWLTKKELYYMGGPQISTRLRMYAQMLKFTSEYCDDENCDVDTCTHVKPTYQATLLDVLAAIPTDEDYAFTGVLRAISTSEEPVAWLPKRVWVNNRGQARKDITAMNGDAGNENHEYPDLLFSEEDATQEIVSYLTTKGVSVTAKNLKELTVQLSQRTDFQQILKQERDMFMEHGFVHLSPDPYGQLSQTYGSDVTRYIEKAFYLYALQTFLLSIQ